MVNALSGAGPVQNAYYVPDIEKAARHYAEVFGWGPFFVLEHIPLEFAKYRGDPAEFDHSSAYGQAGDLMIEFITQHNDGPSAVRDMYAPDESGLHHVAHFVTDLAASVRAFETLGYDVALEARTTTGVDFVMVDACDTLSHMIELYEPNEALRGFYSYVKHKAADWDGTDPVRYLSP